MNGDTRRSLVRAFDEQIGELEDTPPNLEVGVGSPTDSVSRSNSPRFGCSDETYMMIGKTNLRNTSFLPNSSFFLSALCISSAFFGSFLLSGSAPSSSTSNDLDFFTGSLRSPIAWNSGRL